LIAKFAQGERLKLPTLIGIAFIHLAALGSIWTFTIHGLIAFLLLFWLTGGIGICLGYHRLLTHASFKTHRPLKVLITLFGVLALQGGPASWVSAHRLHHKEVEQELDPHTPLVNFLWSHFVWLFFDHPELKTDDQLKRYAADIMDDRVMVFFEKTYAILYAFSALLILGLGYGIGALYGYAPAGLEPGMAAGWTVGLSMLFWGVFLRTVLVWHATWFVNSATHVWGYRNFDTDDDSRNSWWVALITFGEGWHNNHHADARSAAHGMKWFEIDFTYITIRAMALIGLAWDIARPRKLDQMS